MRRFTIFHRRVAAGLALVVLLVFGAPAVPSAADAVCPKCGAPLEPGALFCGRCGAKVEAPAAQQQAGVPDRRGAVVQVVAAYDTELTSTYGSLAFESNMRVDSILGSAFAVAPGEFVTDSGLLVGAKSVSLRISSGRSVPASLVGSDPMIGVALLKADLPEVAVLDLRTEEPPRVGETLEALGFPSGVQASRDPVVSAGVVSGLHRGPAGIRPIEDYLQTDASLPRGLAGGPMLDSSGRVVGMSTAFVWGSQVNLGQSGIGYAVPAEWIGRALAWMRAGATPRAWMGAHAIPVDSEVRERFKLPSNVRLVVDQVFPDSPAAAAGLKRGDGLLKVQGEEASNLTRLQQSLLSSKPGESVVVDATRSGEAVHVAVTLAPRPDKPRLTGIDALRFFGDINIVPAQGDRLVVASVTPGSELARIKVAPGDILQSVLSKKDWVHGAKDNSRWRSVRTVADLEARLATAYSDLDFCLGLRFKGKDGTKREHYLWKILTPTGAI